MNLNCLPFERNLEPLLDGGEIGVMTGSRKRNNLERREYAFKSLGID